MFDSTRKCRLRSNSAGGIFYVWSGELLSLQIQLAGQVAREVHRIHGDGLPLCYALGQGCSIEQIVGGRVFCLTAFIESGQEPRNGMIVAFHLQLCPCGEVRLCHSGKYRNLAAIRARADSQQITKQNGKGRLNTHNVIRQ